MRTYYMRGLYIKEEKENMKIKYVNCGYTYEIIYDKLV